MQLCKIVTAICMMALIMPGSLAMHHTEPAAQMVDIFGDMDPNEIQEIIDTMAPSQMVQPQPAATQRQAPAPQPSAQSAAPQAQSNIVIAPPQQTMQAASVWTAKRFDYLPGWGNPFAWIDPAPRAELWERAYDIKEFVERYIESGDLLSYIFGNICQSYDELYGNSPIIDFTEMKRMKDEENQQAYEYLLHCQVELQHFEQLLCKCGTPQDHADHFQKFLGEISAKLRQLDQTIKSIEMLTRVDHMTVAQMADRMEAEKIAPHGRRSKTFDDLIRFLGRCFLGGILNASITTNFDGEKPADTTIKVGPFSKKYSNEPANEQPVIPAIRDKHAELSAEANADEATQSATTADPAPTADVQQQLNLLENEWKQLGKQLTADQQNLLTALHEPIITTDNIQTGSAQNGSISPDLLDLVTTTTMTAIEQARAGHMREANALADMKNYLILCADGSASYFAQALFDNANVPAVLTGMANIQKDVNQQEVFLGLMLFNEACEITGWLKGTPAKANLERVITDHIQEDLRRGLAIAAELKTKTANLFKDGTFIGICRIAGYIGGTVTFGVAMQWTASLLSRAISAENTVLTNVAAKTAEVGELEQAVAQGEAARPPAAAKGGTNQPAVGAKPLTFNEPNINHIFKNDPGHLLDTPQNRQLILDMAAEANNYYPRADIHGNLWCAKILEDGTQVWACVRDNKIINGGLNKLPISWNDQTGLAKLVAPKGKKT